MEKYAVLVWCTQRSQAVAEEIRRKRKERNGAILVEGIEVKMKAENAVYI